MGTRNLTIIRSQGEIKVAQYFQYDGYPSAQGAAIARFIQDLDFDLANLKEKVNALVWQEQTDYRLKTNSHLLIALQFGGLKSVEDSREFLNDSLFCEWAYELDLDTETVKVYKGWQKTGVDAEGEDIYGPCKMVREFPFKDFDGKAIAELEQG